MMDNFNNPGYSPYNYASSFGFPSQPNTNAIFVTSLEEAVMRTTARPSDMVYFHQNGDYFYRVKVDMDGRKTWAQYRYTLPDQTVTVPVTKADIQAIEDRLKQLEEKLASKEEPSNAKKSS